MVVKLISSSPLWLASSAIHMSHDNGEKSDTKEVQLEADQEAILNNNYSFNSNNIVGPKDKELIDRVGNKYRHKSVLEQLVYWFEFSGISRALLQELARHRTARLTVKSTRYTLNKLKEIQNPLIKLCTKEEMNAAEDCGAGAAYCEITNECYLVDQDLVRSFLVMTDEPSVNIAGALALERLRRIIHAGISNDKAKYALVESFGTKLQWQIDGRNLQNFLELRTDRTALWEIRDLAELIYKSLPREHKYLYEPYVASEKLLKRVKQEENLAVCQQMMDEDQ